MVDKNIETPDSESPRTLTDDEIVTERKVRRRSFLSTTGAVLIGAAGIVSGASASGLHNPQDDPNKRPADPDKRPADPDKRVDDPHKRPEDRRKKEDDTHKRADDPDKRPANPDRKPADPDKKPDDPHRI